MTGSIMKRIEELLQVGRPRIGMGMASLDEEILSSLRDARSFADVIIVGIDAPGFECRSVDNPEDELPRMLVAGEVDGIIRGTIDDFRTYKAYCALACHDERQFVEAPLMEDAYGRQFFVVPASNPEGWTREEKLRNATGTIGVMSMLGMTPRVGVLAGVRHKTYQDRRCEQDDVKVLLNRTYEDAEFVVAELRQSGVDATNYAVELNTAVEEGCNLIVEINGMVGNQVFRALCLIGGGKLLLNPRLGLPHPYEDNSRNEKSFLTHVKWVAAWVNSRRNASPGRTPTA